MANTRSRRFLLVAAMASIGLVILVPLGAGIRDHLEYRQDRRETASLLGSLKSMVPDGVNERQWTAATDWAITAYHNVCFSESHVPLKASLQFSQDLKEKLKDEIDLSTIEWIWNRLAETSPHGHKYISKFSPAFRQHVYHD